MIHWIVIGVTLGIGLTLWRFIAVAVFWLLGFAIGIALLAAFIGAGNGLIDSVIKIIAALVYGIA